jgi:hypothetical protein
MSRKINELVSDVVAAPLGEVIASVGEGVAEAQQALDEGSLAKTLEIYTTGDENTLAMLRDIGYRPTFYALPDTTGEVRVSMSLGQGAQQRRAAASTPSVAAQLARVGRNVAFRPKMYATPVDGAYANRFGYQANISARLTFKIVPVPAPDGFDELRVLPDFRGRTLAEALGLAEQLGLEVEVRDGSGVLLDDADGDSEIREQEPEYTDPPTIVRAGDEVVLVIEPADGPA